jgi:hypothetical protein
LTAQNSLTAVSMDLLNDFPKFARLLQVMLDTAFSRLCTSNYNCVFGRRHIQLLLSRAVGHGVKP